MQNNGNDKPRYWIAISKVDSVDMNELFARHGIWYANQDQAQARIRMVLPGHYIALRKGGVVHAIGKVRSVEKVHGVGQSKGLNDMRVFFVECLQGENVGEPGWTRINKRVRSYGQRVFVEVLAEDEIKEIWGTEAQPLIGNGTRRQKGWRMMNEMLDTRLKTILALSGRANTGKTQTIKKVCRLLLEAYPDAQVSWVHPKEAPVESFDGDICLFMEIGGTLIGVESQGDPKSRLPQSLKMFAEHQPPCDVILCATRTWGSTCQAVKQLRTVDNYDIVRISKKLRVTNDEYANHILALIENLLAGKETQP